MTPPAVSVIIPAHNASATLAETLESLRQQTWPQWEANIIENGSSDDTAAIAAQYSRLDPRIRCTSLTARGVSHARNAGLELARHDWVLFLDADDWIVPGHLQRLTEHLAAHPHHDAVHCGWARVSDDREILWEERGPDEEDLYPRLARTCAFAIHACIARRARIQEVGGFDPALRTGEDWDLWLRLARAGTRFGHVPEVLAHYRARPGSASMDARRLLADSLEVLHRAYAPDARVRHPLPAYAHGFTPELWPLARLQNLLWASGMIIGGGGDGVPLLGGLTREEIAFDPQLYASCLHSAVAAVRSRPLHHWVDWHRELEPAMDRFLATLETLAGRPGLRRATQRQLERLTVEQAELAMPLTLGRAFACSIELTQPLDAPPPAAGAERAFFRLCWQGERLGHVELPVVDGSILPSLLKDAIATEWAWPLLGRYFSTTIYPTLVVRKEEQGWTVLRAGRVLAERIPGATSPDWAAAHDRIGWTVFLQEAWGLPAAAEGELYGLAASERARFADAVPTSGGSWKTIELSERRLARQVWSPPTHVLLTVGGVPVAAKTVTRRGRLSAATLRAVFNLETGFELCRVVVREAVLGQPPEGTLRSRLAAAARRRARLPGLRVASPGVMLAPGAEKVLGELAQELAAPLAVWPRRRDARCATPQTQRATLPRALRPDLEHLCRSGQEPLLQLPGAGDAAGALTLVHAPEVFWQPATVRAAAGAAPAASPGADGEFFEGLFAAGEDPWRYETAYEQVKYEQTLSLLPPRRFRRALEIACAEGHFTVQLAPRVERLLATDVSTTALARTRARCAGQANIDYDRLDLLRDRIRGRYDLIVCSEVLYYTGSRSALAAVAAKLARALRPNGLLVTAHAHAVVDEPDRPGFDWEVPFGGKTIGEVLGATRGLQLLRELRTPLYRIQVFQKRSRWRRWWDRREPQRTLLARQPTALEPEVEAHVLWHGRHAGGPPQVTAELPILMYHRIARDGPAGLARYRVTPEEFEAQLAHLRARGYTSATFDEWREAMATKRPLPGRRVLITFDDGYRDFYEEAWPRLKRYGFNATVFLPTGWIGRSSEWDQVFGAPAPLMDWPQILALDREGVQFGAHTVSHPLLTSLPPDEVAAELLRSRAVLQENLGERILSIAYPFGDCDAIVRSVAASCGYRYAVTCEDRAAGLHEPLLALPRREVRGGLTPTQFQRLLGESADPDGATASAPPTLQEVRG